jgi:hypothetical protein
VRIEMVRFFPVVLALAVSGCGGCVNPGEANGVAAGNGNANGGSTPPTAGSGTGGGKMMNRVTITPTAVRLLQSATLKDGG